MAHWLAEFVVPISAMKAVAKRFGDSVVGKEQDVWNIGKVVVCAQFFGATRHFLGANFFPDSKGSSWCSVPFTR